MRIQLDIRGLSTSGGVNGPDGVRMAPSTWWLQLRQSDRSSAREYAMVDAADSEEDQPVYFLAPDELARPESAWFGFAAVGTLVNPEIPYDCTALERWHARWNPRLMQAGRTVDDGTHLRVQWCMELRSKETPRPAGRALIFAVEDNRVVAIEGTVVRSCLETVVIETQDRRELPVIGIGWTSAEPAPQPPEDLDPRRPRMVSIRAAAFVDDAGGLHPRVGGSVKGDWCLRLDQGLEVRRCRPARASERVHAAVYVGAGTPPTQLQHELLYVQSRHQDGRIFPWIDPTEGPLIDAWQDRFTVELRGLGMVGEDGYRGPHPGAGIPLWLFVVDDFGCLDLVMLYDSVAMFGGLTGQIEPPLPRILQVVAVGY